ncbi:hypothetical protein [Brevibacterium samyangense]|uniref:Uncharacterized protein n=1 Tax=Brevibacterium samyangense TaxID=366888 RepID=A0ABP5EPI5_9MICO
MNEQDDALGFLAQDFADDLTDTVRAVVDDAAPFVATKVSGVARVSVRQSPSEGIPLKVNGDPLLTLLVSYECCLDGAEQYLAVEKSEVRVFAGAKTSREPLFRYEYDRKATRVPAAHIQIHAHRDAFTATMIRAGMSTPRGTRRARSNEVPSVSELHFPVGGHRFRPGLEDVLEMLIDEFGIDGASEARKALRAKRVEWRRKQTRSAVRDDPESAVEVLRSLGYSVSFTGDGPLPEPNLHRLSQP